MTESNSFHFILIKKNRNTIGKIWVFIKNQINKLGISVEIEKKN
jgi:hypothetical protein